MNAPLRIGIVGLGTVGSATVSLLQEHAELLAKRAGRPVEIAAVCARDPNKKRSFNSDGLNFVSDPIALANDPGIDCIVELIGGEEGIAKDLVETALSNKKAVVTANKAMMAHYGLELAELAEENGVPLAFEASVAGGVPVIKALKDSLSSNQCHSVMGILNGTCNYILTEMKNTGRTFEDVLKEAQEKGYAEADPTFDVGGIDSAHKLAIVSSIAFGISPHVQAIETTGIESITSTDISYATQLNYSIKLLGCATQTEQGVHMEVRPCMVQMDAPLAIVDGVLNAITLKANKVGYIFLEGPGAGGDATASAVVADIIDIARGNTTLPFGVPAASLTRNSAENSSLTSCYYIRVDVADEPGVLADITRIFHGHNISVDVMIQPRHTPNEPASLVFTTHATSDKAVQAVSASLSVMPTVINPPQLLRIVS